MAQLFVVGRQDANQTIAAFLKTRLLLPWSKTKQLIEAGAVRVGGQPVNDPAARLKLGKQVEVQMPGETKSAPKPKPKPKTKSDAKTAESEKPLYDGPMPVLVYSDDTIVVVDKPAGLTTMRHEEEAAEFGERGRTYLPITLAEMLPTMLGRPGKKLYAVHRIDRDTTGLVVFARTKFAEEHLTEQFKAHTIERRYLALVRGIAKSGKIESTLVRDRGDGRRGSSTEPTEDGQRAVTHVTVLEQWPKFAMVECQLETGRTHQVRIHLGEAGTPLCGERVYDRPLHGAPLPDGSGAARPMLHATRLGLVHPVTEDKMSWESTIPKDMQKLYDRWDLEADPTPIDTGDDEFTESEAWDFEA